MIRTIQPPVRVPVGDVFAADKARLEARKMNRQQFDAADKTLTLVQGAIVVTTIAAITVLILAGQNAGVSIVAGFAGTALMMYVGQRRQTGKQEEIKQKLDENTGLTLETAKRVNGGTEKLVAQHRAEVEALKEQHKAETSLLDKNVQRERHELKNHMQNMMGELDMANAAIVRLTQENGRLQGIIGECKRRETGGDNI